MRIRELKLTRYGKFTDQFLALPFKDRDIHLIVGPNEAGKSTVRNAIGDWLFGFPVRTPLAFLHPMPELRIGGVIERRDSRATGTELLAFDRIKGNKNTVRSPDDEPLPDGILQSWLGSLQAQAFSQMYALDHKTLVEGGVGILSASDDIGRMLFQSASGVEHLGDALKGLQAKADALWAPKKSDKREYYRALEDFDAANAEFKRSTLRTRDWKEQHDALTAKESQLAAAKIQDIELRQQLSRLERIRRVRPLLLVLDTARAQRNELLATGDIAVLEEAAAQVYRHATQDISMAEADIAKVQREVDETQGKLLATIVDKNILAFGKDVTVLNESRLQFRAHRTDMVKRAEEVRLKWVRVQELSQSLGWPLESEDAVRQRLPATPLRARLASLIRDHAAFALNLKNARTSLSDHQEHLQQAANALSELSADAIDPGLSMAVEQAMRLGDHESVMAVLESEIDELAQRIEEGLTALGNWRQPIDSLRAMLAPETAHIRNLIDAHRADTTEEKTYRDALNATAKEVARQELDLQQFVRNFQPVSREQVLNARIARDVSWKEIKQVPQSLMERSARFEALISEADKLADDRLERAQFEADRQSKANALEHKQRECLDLEERLQAVKRRIDERIAKWDVLATTCGLPGLPLDMALTWLQLRKDVLELLSERSVAELRRSAQQEAAAKIRDSLWHKLGHETPESLAPELSACLREARALLTKADQAQGQRTTLENQIREGQRSLNRLTASLKAAQEDWDTWTQAWQETLESLGYSADTPVDQVDAEIKVMQDIESQLDHIRIIRSERIEAMQADLDGLAAAAANLSARVAPDLANHSPEDVSLELGRRLDVAQKAEIEANHLSTRLHSSQAELTEAQNRLQEVHARLAPLMATAGVDEVKDLGRAIERSDELRAIQHKIQSTEQDLIQASDGLSLEDLRTENESVGADELKAELDRLTKASRDVVNQIATLSKELGAQRITYDALNGTDQAARAEAQRQEAIAAMADTAERYLRLQTTVRLLKWSIEKFRETKQGPMLSKASTLFNQLTMGSFSRLLVDSDGDTPRLFGVRPDGAQVDINGMSEGSRDQLYLALRLAALELQVEQGFAMPLIADDLFINFDDRRTAAGLKVFAELSLNRQVIILTHHEHVVELAKDVLGSNLNVVQV
jgi:uncharacterized protein YhaN